MLQRSQKLLHFIHNGLQHSGDGVVCVVRVVVVVTIRATLGKLWEESVRADNGASQDTTLSLVRIQLLCCAKLLGGIVSCFVETTAPLWQARLLCHSTDSTVPILEHCAQHTRQTNSAIGIPLAKKAGYFLILFVLRLAICDLTAATAMAIGVSRLGPVKSQKSSETDDDIVAMKMLRYALIESLRLYPEPPVLIRWAREQDILPPGGSQLYDRIKVLRGTDMFISTWNLHRSPDLWEAPETFDPTRWERPFTNPSVEGWKGFDPDRITGLYPNEIATDFAFLPFGGGARKCVGDQFAMMEATVTMSMMIKNFNFEFAIPPEEAVLVGSAFAKDTRPLVLSDGGASEEASAFPPSHNTTSSFEITPSPATTREAAAPTTSYYDLRFERGVPGGCQTGGKGGVLDVECYDSTLNVVGTGAGTSCYQLTDDSVRCETGLNERGRVALACTGNRLPEAHNVLVRMPYIRTPGACSTCGIYSNTVFLYRQCKTNENANNVELFPSFFCSGLKDADECFEGGLLFTDLFCVSGDADGLAASAADAEIERCLYDSTAEGLSHTETSLDKRLEPLSNALVNDNGGSEVTAFYRLYYEYRKAESATNCESPLEDMYFVCANGRLPEITVETGVCGLITLSSGQQFRRCMGYSISSGEVEATCQGGSEESVKILAFQPASELPACLGQVVSSLLWATERCEGMGDVSGIRESVTCSSDELSLSNSDTLWACEGTCEDGSCSGMPDLLLTKQATECFITSLPESMPQCSGPFGIPSFLWPVCWFQFLFDFIRGLFGQ